MLTAIYILISKQNSEHLWIHSILIFKYPLEISIPTSFEELALIAVVSLL